jgi:hypothetical protein
MALQIQREASVTHDRANRFVLKKLQQAAEPSNDDVSAAESKSEEQYRNFREIGQLVKQRFNATHAKSQKSEFMQPTNRKPSSVRFWCTMSTSGSSRAINFA